MKKYCFLLIFLMISVLLVNAEKWVGKGATYQLLDGSKTANGDVFQRETMSAACNGFKFGSEVLITNAKNGKQINVTINDRVKNDSDYFMLLTPKAAKELGMEWDTGIIVVDAKFSDVNSSEILDIKGLLPEGEIDVENLKKFPYIEWPTKDETVKNNVIEKNEIIEESKIFPEEETKKEIPQEKETSTNIDTDEKNGYTVNEKETSLPQEEMIKTPNIKETVTKIDEDLGNFVSEEKQDLGQPEIQEARIPDTKMPDLAMDKDADEAMYTDREKKDGPSDKEKAVDKDVEETKPFQNEKIEEKIEQKEKSVWLTSLEKGTYIRFSTTFDKEEGQRRYDLFIKIFSNLVGLNENNKYILLVGPVKQNEINAAIIKMRKFGYKDAYIIDK